MRQLLNLLEQAVALATTSVIPATLVQGALREDAGVLAPFEEACKQFERDYLVRLLKITGGNVTQAATLARRNRTEFTTASAAPSPRARDVQGSEDLTTCASKLCRCALPSCLRGLDRLKCCNCAQPVAAHSDRLNI